MLQVCIVGADKASIKVFKRTKFSISHAWPSKYDTENIKEIILSEITSLTVINNQAKFRVDEFSTMIITKGWIWYLLQ